MYVNTSNVLADTKFGRADRVIVVGSHLDSVPAGPGTQNTCWMDLFNFVAGINDNG